MAKYPKGTLFGKPREQVIKRPGAFTAKAKRAGMSVPAYGKKVLSGSSRASTRTKRQAALAKTLRGFARRRKAR